MLVVFTLPAGSPPGIDTREPPAPKEPLVPEAPPAPDEPALSEGPPPFVAPPVSP
jgi:hypothetical protein